MPTLSYFLTPTHRGQALMTMRIQICNMKTRILASAISAYLDPSAMAGIDWLSHKIPGMSCIQIVRIPDCKYRKDHYRNIPCKIEPAFHEACRKMWNHVHPKYLLCESYLPWSSDNGRLGLFLHTQWEWSDGWIYDWTPGQPKLQNWIALWTRSFSVWVCEENRMKRFLS